MKLLEPIKQNVDILQKSLKRADTLPPVDTTETPFALSSGWTWARFGECIEPLSGQHLNAEEQNVRGEGLPYLTSPADFGATNPTATRWTSTIKVIANRDDLLITVKGAGVGKANILKLEKAAIGRQLMAIRPFLLNRDFVSLCVIASYEQFQSLSIGSTVPGISREDILHFPFCIPPLLEQKRIVAAVNRMMALCDELEAGLRQAEEDGERLLSTVVRSLLMSASEKLAKESDNFVVQ